MVVQGDDDEKSPSKQSSLNFDSQGNPFLDAKSHDDDNDDDKEEEVSVASDETTLDDQQEESIQDITTLLANQRLLLATPATGLQTQDETTTCPRDNTTIVPRQGNKDETGLNALVPQATSSPPKQDSQTSNSLARQQSESQAFYTAESEAEDTQGDDDTSLTAVAKGPNNGNYNKATSHVGESSGKDTSTRGQQEESTETEASVPKEVTVAQPTSIDQSEFNKPSGDANEQVGQAISSADYAKEGGTVLRPTETSEEAPIQVGNEESQDAEARMNDDNDDMPMPDDNGSDKEEVISPMDGVQEAPTPSVDGAVDESHSERDILVDAKAPSEATEESPSGMEAHVRDDPPMTGAKGGNEEAPDVETESAALAESAPVQPATRNEEEASTNPEATTTLPANQHQSTTTEPATAPPSHPTAPENPQTTTALAQDDDVPMPDADDDEEGAMPEADASQEQQEEDAMESAPPSEATFSVGTIVQVQDRTWPGINKQGGVGRITKVHRDGSVVSYDVSYVLGGREKKVEAVFVSKQDEAEPKRNRSPKADEKLSPQLLASLAADGFDTEGKVELEAVRRVGVKTGTKRKALADENKSNEHAAASGKKKRQKGKAAESKTTTSRKRKHETTKSTPLPALSDEEKRELADAKYQERFRLAERQSVISVVASSLSDHDMTTLQLLCKETRNQNVKVRTTETFNANKSTLVVAALDPQSTPENATSRNRTLKIMRAMLSGVPIVSPEWVRSCLNQGSALAPTSDMYVRTVPVKTNDPLVSAKYGASLLAARIHQADGNERLLSNARVLLCGQFNTSEGSPRKADIQALLRDAGSTILPSVGGAMNKLKKVGNDDDASKIVLLCDECPKNDRCGISTGLAKEAKAALQRHGDGVLVVNSTWLFDSISCGEMAPAKPFKPQSPRARDLWKLCSHS